MEDNKKIDKIIENNNKSMEVKRRKTGFRSIIPNDVQNMNKLMQSMSKISSCSWENDGDKILSNDKHSLANAEKRILKYLILKKVPDNKRAKMWLLSSGAKREIANNPNYYESLKTHFPKGIPSPYESQIGMDLKRTYPEDPFFQDCEILAKMNSILVAYSRRNMSIGYCQGFNFIVGRLLKVFENEEEAFWVFVQIIENILPINYYAEMAGTIIDQYILNKLVEIYLPELNKHFQQINFEITPITLQWFVSLFSQNLNCELGMLIWDILFIDGSIILFKAALSVLKILQEKILKLSCFEEVYELIDSSTKELNDSTSMIFSLLFKKYEFDDTFINNNRASLESEVTDNLRKTKEKTKQLMKQKYKQNNRVSFVEQGINCDTEWPICIYDTDFKTSIHNFLILKPLNQPVTLMEDYFEVSSNKMKPKKTKSESITNYIDFSKLLIERRSHLCESVSTKEEFCKEGENKLLFEEKKKSSGSDLNNQESQKTLYKKLRSYTSKRKENNPTDYDKFIFEINSKYKEMDLQIDNISPFFHSNSFRAFDDENVNIDDFSKYI